jgi:hypothetical protein
MISISWVVQAPSSVAIPSQVADRIKRFDRTMPLISLFSNKATIDFPETALGKSGPSGAEMAQFIGFSFLQHVVKKNPKMA